MKPMSKEEIFEVGKKEFQLIKEIYTQFKVKDPTNYYRGTL